MDKKERSLSDKLLNHNGMERQLSVVQGELCELVTAISDFFWRPDKKMPIEEILDEIIDVELMLLQLKKILLIQDKKIKIKLEELKEIKYNKLLDKLKNNLL